jgi:hypothetical protein
LITPFDRQNSSERTSVDALFDPDRHLDCHRLTIDRLQRSTDLLLVPLFNLISDKDVRYTKDHLIAITQ